MTMTASAAQLVSEESVLDAMSNYVLAGLRIAANIPKTSRHGK
jgi:hypothetical protein